MGADLNNVLEVLAAAVGDYDLVQVCVDADIALCPSLVVFEVGLDLNMLCGKWRGTPFAIPGTQRRFVTVGRPCKVQGTIGISCIVIHSEGAAKKHRQQQGDRTLHCLQIVDSLEPLKNTEQC